MKINYTTLPALLIAAILLFAGCSGSRRVKADPPLDSTAVKTLIYAPAFVFLPQYVNPSGGRRRDLTPGYELTVLKDSIISYLPYFGRGFIAPLSPTDLDYDFTSTKFTYNVAKTRRGWAITIKVNDQKYLREMYLRVFDNGAADLTLTILDRSSISYDGYISRRKEKEEKNEAVNF
jgi:hypothetical protein